MSLSIGRDSVFVPHYVSWPYDTATVWEISPESVATVSAAGRIRALRPGTAVLSAYPKAAPQFRVSRLVQVLP